MCVYVYIYTYTYTHCIEVCECNPLYLSRSWGDSYYGGDSRSVQERLKDMGQV